MSNTFLRQGINFSNDAVQSTLGLDVNPIDIDKASFEAMEINNIVAYIQEGMSEENARLKAKQNRSNAMSNARKAASMFDTKTKQ